MNAVACPGAYTPLHVLLTLPRLGRFLGFFSPPKILSSVSHLGDYVGAKRDEVQFCRPSGSG